MKKVIVFLFVACLFFSCDRKVEKAVRNEVVVVFDNCPDQSGTHRIGFGRSRLMCYRYATISYIDSTGALSQFDPKEVGRDTLVVPTFHGYAEIQHQYEAIEFDSYLLKAGDTVLVSYDKEHRPMLTSLVYSELTDVYNLPYSSPKAIQTEGYYIENILREGYFRQIFKYFKDEDTQRKFPSLRDMYRDRYVDLDSLSRVYDDYLKTFVGTVDSLETNKIIDTYYADYLRNRFVPANRPTPKEIVQSDSLLHFISYYDLAQDYCSDDDHVTAFDKMVADTVATDLAKRVILKRRLNCIITGEGRYHPFPKNVVERCISQYVGITGDSLYLQQVMAAPTAVSPSSYAMALEDKNGQTTTLEEILKQNKGKVVYVDFWASWCAPCRAQLPYSKELQKRLSGKAVTFLFLSTDTNRKAWLNAVKEEADAMTETYRIVDPDPVFLRELKVRTIPRYMIFDPSGKLVNEDAARPSTKGLEQDLINLIGS